MPRSPSRWRCPRFALGLSLPLRLHRQLHQRRDRIAPDTPTSSARAGKPCVTLGMIFSPGIVNQRILRHQFLAVLRARDLLFHRLHLVAQDHRTQAQGAPRAQVRNHKRRFEGAGLTLAVLARHELQAVLARPQRKPGVVLDLLARDGAGGGRSHLQGDRVAHHRSLPALWRRESRR